MGSYLSVETVGPPARILIVGLDGTGKTTILYKLKNEDVTTSPTIYPNFESITYKQNNYNIWDVGGHDKVRILWKNYYRQSHGIIFVIDSSDKDRIVEVNEELQKILKDDELTNTVLLILANKQDLPNSLSISEIIEKLSLHSIVSRQWNILATTATNVNTLYEAFHWLHEVI